MIYGLLSVSLLSIEEAVVSNLICVVEPLTDSGKWESVETLETSFEKKEELLREMGKKLFEDMIVS